MNGIPPPSYASLSCDYLLPKRNLLGERDIYFSAILLTVWDNIHGPKILTVWLNNSPEICQEGAVAPETLIQVANFTLNDEAGRIDKLDGIETKFYSLRKYDIIASAFVFALDAVKGKKDVFSFILVLPYSEMTEYLARLALCQTKVKQLIENHFVGEIRKKQDTEKGSLTERVERQLDVFSEHLRSFTQTMVSIRYCGLPEKIRAENTYLCVFEKNPELKTFLTHAITSHLQTSGYTLVVGENKDVVNKMISTLGLFLSPKERKMSRYVWEEEKETEDMVHIIKASAYEPDLFVQGCIMSGGFMNCTLSQLEQNCLPCTVVHMGLYEVRVVEVRVPLYLRKKEDAKTARKQETNPSASSHVRKKEEAVSEKAPKKLEHIYISMSQLAPFKEVLREFSSPLVQGFLTDLALLPPCNGIRESFVSNFMRLLKLKALALTKYLEEELKRNESSEQSMNAILTLGVKPALEKDKQMVNQAQLMVELFIDCVGDLYVLLAFAEKIRPNTYFDVLGDPQKQAEMVLKEFDAF